LSTRAKARRPTPSAAGASARSCNRRFTTYERIDEIPYMVVKKDGRRERFDRQKDAQRPAPRLRKAARAGKQWRKLWTRPRTFLVDAPERERTTSEIGELIMEHLKGLDTVAYIRFASVYRDFKDVREFKEELEGLLSQGPSKARNEPVASRLLGGEANRARHEFTTS
jgi:transcriptional repressor NrdR